MARPRIHDEDTTPATRQALSRRARIAAGAMPVHVVLPPEAAAALARIIARDGITKGEAIARALVRDAG
jgi:hypothetical protein